MKYSLLFLIFMVFFQNNLFSQETHLIISSKRNDAPRVIMNDSKIKVQLFNGDKIIGRYRPASDSTIYIDSNTVLLSDISKLWGRSKNAKYASLIVGGSGGLGVIAGASIISQAINSGGIAAAFIGYFGGAIVTTGIIAVITGAVIISVGRTFDEKDWVFQLSSISNA